MKQACLAAVMLAGTTLSSWGNSLLSEQHRQAGSQVATGIVEQRAVTCCVVMPC